MLGGRAAEELIFKEMTSGASNDIENATNVARTMIIDYGMSDLGPMNLNTDKRYSYEQRNLSPEMLGKIDEEVKRLTDISYKHAVNALKSLRKNWTF